MSYLIVFLLLDATTGQPLEFGKYSETSYADYQACEKAKANLGPQKAKDGKVRIFACATEKQVTRL
ncbi:MAG TPA: hypothetical protein VFS24_01035 [Steroidobacteraceae bacterium]|nr:hypothetical protein [Steroidobacteraceae bacterium]